MMENAPRPDWWRPVWICLQGEQPMPNVLPILAYRPETVYILHTDDLASVHAARGIMRLLQRRGGVGVALATTPAFDAEGIAASVRAIVSRAGQDRVLLNWTGGTKPMSVFATIAMGGAPTLYYDRRAGGAMVARGAFEPLPPAQPLTMDEMFLLHADVKVLHSSRKAYQPHTAAVMQDLVRKEPDTIQQLLGYRAVLKGLPRSKSRNSFAPLKQPIRPPFGSGQIQGRILESMTADKLIMQDARGFQPTPQGLDYLNGFWWEDIVFGFLCEALDRVVRGQPPRPAMNIEVQWGGSITQNELDIAFLYNDQLFHISCTTAAERDLEKRRMSAIEFAQRFGGRFAKTMIASTASPKILSKIGVRNPVGIEMPAWEIWTDPDDLDNLLRRWLGIRPD